MLTAIAKFEGETFFKKMMLNTALSSVNAKAFKVLPIDSFLWGYEDELLSLAQKFSFDDEVSFAKFGILMTVRMNPNLKVTIFIKLSFT